MRNSSRFLPSLVFLLTLTLPLHVAAQERVALVIGNSAYRYTAELKNPRNDAADMGAALARLGYRVFQGLDLDKPGMERTIRAFADALPGAESAVFFYAGHGLQVSEQNYLVPVDARLASPSALDFEVVRLDIVQRAMERSAKSNVLFVDACRDNPLARSLAGTMGTRSGEVGRGLAVSTSSLGTLISFSTQPGNVALDGEGRNSPYAAALTRHIGDPNDDLSTILIKVRNDVVRATAARQVPWEHSSLWARFYFTGRGDERLVRDAQAPEEQRELALWNAARNSGDRAALRAYLDRYPQGRYVTLAKMFISRLERWDDERPAPRIGANRPGSVDQLNAPASPAWRMPSSAGDARARCERLYALLAARVRDVRQQCGAVLRGLR
jgi:hypothetical protein